jgi:AcrR family transcriptional regulator
VLASAPVARVTRATAKAMTRQRLLDEAERLFRERGYAATSLEQIAEAAEVTKGAIYGHFSSKEDLLLSAIEAAPAPDYGAVLNDLSRPLRERLAEFGRTRAVAEDTTDKAGLAVSLEFIAAVLRSPDAVRRFGAELARRLEELAAGDEEQPRPGIAPVEAWAIGHALSVGLQIYRCLAPEILTPDLFEHAYELIAGLYPED